MRKYFGPVYDPSQDRVTIYEGTSDQLLKAGVNPKYIYECFGRTNAMEFNIRYSFLRAEARKMGSAMVKSLNQHIEAEVRTDEPLKGIVTVERL